MTSAPRYNPHYTVADYEQWQGDWELWNGVAVAMSPSPTRRHQQAIFNLAMQIKQGLDSHKHCHCELIVDVDWRVSEDTVVRPDLSVLCTSSKSDYIYDTPTLIAEVLSPSSAYKDRNEKRSLYESKGVDWYLIIDTDFKTVNLLKNHQKQFSELTLSLQPQVIELHDGCAFSLDKTKIFD